MRVTLLIGSSRVGRQSHKIAFCLESELQQKGIQTDMIDLGKRATPLPGSSSDHYHEYRDEVVDMSARVKEADALIFITPEYHGSFSGILKNALDNLGTEFYRKPVGVVTVSSGRMGGIAAVAQLQHVILSLGAFALPNKLLIPDVQTAFNESFQLINERTKKSADKFLEEFLWFSYAVHDKKHKERELILQASI